MDEAAAAARAALERQPDDPWLHDVLALAQLERGQKKEARATIDDAIALAPQSADLHAHRALILARSAKKSFRPTSWREPRAAIEEALRLDPHSETALRVRAQVAMISEDPLADEYAEELLALEATDSQAHVIKGVALAQWGAVDGAMRHFDEAARLDPSDPVMAWVGRRSRALQRPFFAPLLFLERASRGHVRIAWVLVVLVCAHSGVPYITLAVIVFWVYMWSAHLYLRAHVGKSPR